MQIEESFRDLKNSRLDFSLEESKTQDAKRWGILLLIAMLAILAACLLGKAAEQKDLQYEFQANTVKTGAVLSLFFLGCQIIKKGSTMFTNKELISALAAFKLVSRWRLITHAAFFPIFPFWYRISCLILNPNTEV